MIKFQIHIRPNFMSNRSNNYLAIRIGLNCQIPKIWPKFYSGQNNLPMSSLQQLNHQARIVEKSPFSSSTRAPHCCTHVNQ